MEKRIGLFKKIAAALLIVAFFLPLSRCADTSTPAGEQIEATETLPGEAVDYTYYYSWDYLDIDDLPLSILVLLAFLWPVIFLALRSWNANPKMDMGLMFLEPFAAGGGSFIVIGVGTLNELYIGSYLALLAAILFFIGSVTEIVGFFKKRMQK